MKAQEVYELFSQSPNGEIEITLKKGGIERAYLVQERDTWGIVSCDSCNCDSYYNVFYQGLSGQIQKRSCVKCVSSLIKKGEIVK